MYYYSSVPSQCISPHNAFIMDAKCSYPGADSGGGAPGAPPPPPPPLKLEKIRFLA